MKILNSKNIMNKHGFSLAEVMVSVFILVSLFTAVHVVFLTGDASWQANRVQIELQQDLRKAMEQMKDDLRQTAASQITAGPENANGSWATSITFNMISDVTSGATVWNATSTRFVLGGLGGTDLQRIQGSTKVIAQNIQSLQLRREAATPNILEVALIAGQTTPRGLVMTMPLTFKVELRN